MCWKLVAMTLNNEWLRLRMHAAEKGVSGSKPETLRSAAMSSEDKAVGPVKQVPPRSLIIAATFLDTQVRGAEQKNPQASNAYCSVS